MTKLAPITRLILIGEALYGRTWQAQMCDLLQVDSRRVAHWIAGTRPIPDGIWAELTLALRARGNAALKLADSSSPPTHQAESTYARLGTRRLI